MRSRAPTLRVLHARSDSATVCWRFVRPHPLSPDKRDRGGNRGRRERQQRSCHRRSRQCGTRAHASDTETDRAHCSRQPRTESKHGTKENYRPDNQLHDPHQGLRAVCLGIATSCRQPERLDVPWRTAGDTSSRVTFIGPHQADSAMDDRRIPIHSARHRIPPGARSAECGRECVCLHDVSHQVVPRNSRVVK